jgi:uncharacterized protein YyaL (SSP411 family)
MARLAAHTGDLKWTERRDAIVAPFAGAAPQLGVHGATLTRALSWAALPETHLVIIEGEGTNERDTASAMHQAALRCPRPRLAVRLMKCSQEPPAGLPAALRAMVAVGSGTRAYACSGSTCAAPATTLEEWRFTLANFRIRPHD